MRRPAPPSRLTELTGFSGHDRVLVVAPHPDDEAIATGGLLQVVSAARAACRVLVVTDGDNNPWPQRWIERRWRIGVDDRARWGAQRRSEALAALEILGVPAAAARCLGFPDLGMTDLLMAGDARLLAQLSAQIADFAPTHLFLPALGDRHPDHSALHVLVRLALLRHAGSPQLLTFGVHGAAPAGGEVVLNLTPEQQATKYAAIMRHETQMRLSRRRFVAYARAREPFAAATSAADPTHPLAAQLTAGGGGVRIDRARFGQALRGHVLLLVAARSDAAPVLWRIELSGAAAGRVTDTSANRAIATVPIAQTAAETRVELPDAGQFRAAWIKLTRPQPGLFVLDRFGWQTIA